MMSSKEKKKSKIRNYLLGDFSSTDEKFEESLMTDDELFRELEMQEEELIQDYVDDELTDLEKKRFETHFLISKERQEKLQFARSLRKHVDNEHFENPFSVESTQENNSEFASFFSFAFLQKAIPAFAVLLILFAIVWFAFLSSNDGLSPLEKEFAKLNGEEINELENYKSKISLIPGNLRSPSEVSKISKKGLSDKILLRLALPSKTNLKSNFETQLLKDGKVIFTQKEINSYENGKELRVLLPTSLLEKGEYNIRVSHSEMEDSRISYTFLVE